MYINFALLLEVLVVGLIYFSGDNPASDHVIDNFIPVLKILVPIHLLTYRTYTDCSSHLKQDLAATNLFDCEYARSLVFAVHDAEARIERAERRSNKCARHTEETAGYAMEE